MKNLSVCLAAWVALTSSLWAGPLTEARINKIINDVAVVDPAAGAHKANLQDVIKDDLGVQTGIKSRSELVFQDQTLTRIGPETFFSFEAGTREMSLKQGTMLLQVPKGLGGAKIRTAAITAAITGTTIMLENIPGKDVKVLVLEGSLRLSCKGFMGDSLLLLPGKMVIMPPNAKRIPAPVTVDLARVMKTSSLVKMGSKPLPSANLIQAEVETQAKEKRNNNLVDSNIVIQGSGTNVLVASNVASTVNRKGSVTEIENRSLASVPGPTSAGGPGPQPTPPPVTSPGGGSDGGNRGHGHGHGHGHGKTAPAQPTPAPQPSPHKVKIATSEQLLGLVNGDDAESVRAKNLPQGPANNAGSSKSKAPAKSALPDIDKDLASSAHRDSGEEAAVQHPSH